MSNKENILFNAIKTVMLTVRNVQELNIAASARSLTYRTLLSIVPLLAIIFAIARGFGIENIMQSGLFNLMTGGNRHLTEMVTSEPIAGVGVSASDVPTVSRHPAGGDQQLLEEAKGGLFAGWYPSVSLHHPAPL